jgi:hypothetical protein
VLAASESLRILLDLGDDEKIGLAFPGKKAQKLDYVMPRGVWVHLALVCRAPPKRKLSVYADGKHIEDIDGLKDLGLPMREVGRRGARPARARVERSVV